MEVPRHLAHSSSVPPYKEIVTRSQGPAALHSLASLVTCTTGQMNGTTQAKRPELVTTPNGVGSMVLRLLHRQMV